VNILLSHRAWSLNVLYIREITLTWGGGGKEWETQGLWITPLQTQTLKLKTLNEENNDPHNYSIFIFKIISNTRLIITSSVTIFPQFIKKNPTRCNNVSRFYYSVFIWSSTCFGRHTAHHQVPKTALEASGFACVEGWWTRRLWTLSGTVPVPDNVHQLHIHQPSTHAKPLQVFLSYFPECQSFGTIQKYAENVAFTSFEPRTVKPAASRYTDYLVITLLISSLNLSPIFW
jgi:hypothetical protein